jgi:hypothetical protein
MADAEHRVMKQHSRSGITHHRFDALALRFAVAVDLASIAGRFLLVEWTDLKALQGVREQSFAVTTKRALRGMMIATEDPHHGFDRLLFARDTRARQIRARRRCFDCSWHIVQGGSVDQASWTEGLSLHQHHSQSGFAYRRSQCLAPITAPT